VTETQQALRAVAGAAAAGRAVYVVRHGDSLSAIAGRLFGDPGKWPYLYDANRGVVGDNPDVIEVGTVLRARLGGHAAYGRVVTTATAYHAARHARSGDGDGLAPGGAYCKPDCWGDGDDDGYDLSHSPWASASAVPSGRHSYRSARYVGSSRRHSYSSGSYGNVSASSYGGFQACVITRESGGNSQVMNSSGHYGLYQFSAGTWQAYGGSSASFGHASVAEQNRVFNNAIRQGGQSNWSPYDGC
jgi:hypothetical protein